MNCPKCGQNYQQEDVFCGNCGTKLPESVAETTKTTSETANKEAQGEQSVIQTQVTKEIEEVTTNSKEQAFHQHQNINQSVVNQNDTHEHIETPLEQGTQSNNKDTFYEMKQFFISAFTHPDQVLKTEQTFSTKLLLILIIAGLAVVALLFNALIPDQIGFFEVSKSSIVFKFIVSLAIILAVHIGITYLVVRLTILPEVKFNKVFSDYVLINTFTVALLILSAFLFALSSYKFASLIIIIMYLFLTISPAFMLAKYSSIYNTRISSLYGILILLFVLSIIILVFGQNIIEGTLMQNFSKLFGRVI
ncbi:zinc-ribbon domain-containing protein [Staphylococcus caprae]|uniref:zinc-ribbon domain-containing protein n=1 Tax=Staphylococcus caprae TaxID=29380 RepID=UPI00254D3049|nr:zinc-ribbon domain-containing protein [Staphylococcus caprae]MDK6298745.1 zinc ribbon domain-containing protein [Staphylococcus caprae]MDK7231831.1 zinc ribbon domain-containing protein [Staphylococcus caprae]